MATEQNFKSPALPGHTKRNQPRHRTFKAGMVIMSNKMSTISCVVRNLSSHGARLKFEGLFRPPHDFSIMVPTENWAAECQVVWRRGDELGVRFVADRTPLEHAGGRLQVIDRF